MIDSHCHLDHEQFQGEVDTIIKNAHQAGISKLLTISTTLNAYVGLEKISSEHASVYHTVGVHPHHVDETGDIEHAREILQKAADHPKAIGIGESGLDYHYNYSEKANQKAFFEMHMDLCIEKDLPLIVHTREADVDTAELLTSGCQRGNLKGILHCFSSTEALAMKGLELGFYVSASGIITFKKSDALREIFKKVPMDRLLIETDAPYLAPTPYRGKRNEPQYVKYVAEQLAELKGVSVEEILEQTDQNFKTLFKID